MRMRSHHKRRSAIRVMAKRHFFRCCLAMNINQDKIGITAKLVANQRIIQCRKNRIICRHKQIGHQIHRDKPLASGIRHLNNAVPRGAFSHVQRPQQPWFRRDIINNFLFVPDVIAGCQNISTSGKKRITDFRRDAKPASRIFTIYHDKIEHQFISKKW